jgi:hypothetical protein
MKKTIAFCLVLFCLVGTACEKLIIKPDPVNTPEECFESMWQRIHEKYSFLEYKKINWDSVKAVYRPQVHNGMSNIELFRVLDSMLYSLKDGHVNLITPFNISRNWEWYLGYPQNFNYSVLERNYLGDNYFITGPLINQVFLYNSKRIGYFYYGSFSSNISENNLDFVIGRFNSAQTDGLIIDMRDNGGGITNNVFKLINRFVEQKTLVGKAYEKTGKGPHDFTLAQEFYATPAVNEKKEPRPIYTRKPIVVLTNRSCYSACNMFVGFMSTLPNVQLVGNQSGGGGGLPTSYQLPNGWVYRFSSTYMTLPNDFNVEHGIPVDIHQDNLPANEANGIDDILEKALTLF